MGRWPNCLAVNEWRGFSKWRSADYGNAVVAGDFAPGAVFRFFAEELGLYKRAHWLCLPVDRGVSGVAAISVHGCGLASDLLDWCGHRVVGACLAGVDTAGACCPQRARSGLCRLDDVFD